MAAPSARPELALVDPALLGLAISAFLAATILPLASEPLAVALVAAGRGVVEVWAAATLGNVTGSVLNWWLGRAAAGLADRGRLPVSPAALARAEAWFGRFGRPVLLLAWLPVVGDALTLVAGLLRTPLGPFLLLVGLGKGARYALILAPTGALFAD